MRGGALVVVALMIFAIMAYAAFTAKLPPGSEERPINPLAYLALIPFVALPGVFISDAIKRQRERENK